MAHPNQKRAIGSAPRKVKGGAAEEIQTLKRRVANQPRLSDLVPTNWCDSLLTGPRAALAKERAGKWDCRDIEALLRGIQDRLRAAEVATRD